MILASGTGTLDAYEADTFNVAPDRFINFDTRTLADLDRQIGTIGAMVGKAEAAQDMMARLAARREAIVARRMPAARRPSVLFEYCVCIKYDTDSARRFANPGRFIMVGGHLAPDLIRLSGGEPLFTQPGDAVAWTAFEAIRQSQPDMVLVLTAMAVRMPGRTPSRRVRAGRTWRQCRIVRCIRSARISAIPIYVTRRLWRVSP
jgi:ABC-type Fe3+-hydroxamate transport system substrate-binding protein